MIVCTPDAKLSHATNDWADKVDVEDGVGVNDMKDDGNGQVARPAHARHVVDSDAQTDKEYELRIRSLTEDGGANNRLTHTTMIEP